MVSVVVDVKVVKLSKLLLFISTLIFAASLMQLPQVGMLHQAHLQVEHEIKSGNADMNVPLMKRDDHRIKTVECALRSALIASAIVGIVGICAGFSGKARCSKVFIAFLVLSVIVHVASAVTIGRSACSALRDHPLRESEVREMCVEHTLLPILVFGSIVKHLCLFAIARRLFVAARDSEMIYIAVAQVAEETQLKTVEVIA